MRRPLLTTALFAVFIFSFFTDMLAAQEISPSGLSNDQTRAIIELLKEKGILTDQEAIEFMHRIDGTEKDTQPSSISDATNTEPPGSEPATKEDLANLEEKIGRTNDATMLDHRLLTRRIDDMEAGVLDPLVDKAIKSEWTQRITVSGDIRLRYQADAFVDGNDTFVRADDVEETLNTTVDRQRFRYRARLGLKAKLLDYRDANVGKLEAGFRFATGNEDDPISTNDTMGDYFNRDNFVFDRAYLKWKYSPINPVLNRMPEFSIVGGRFANPWFSTDLVWDSDLNFEGVAVSYETDTEQMRPFNVFLTAGIFPLQEEEFNSRDKWLWGVQAGIEYLPRYDIILTLAAAYYDYRNIEGVQNESASSEYWDFTAPESQTKGNTLMDIDADSGIDTALAMDYDILDLYLRSDIGIFHPVHIIMDAQYVHNFGLDSEQVSEVTGYSSPTEDIDGYMVGTTIGYPVISNYGEWNVGLKYKYLGADAVIDAFTDSDFHLGGTNAKGWILKYEYGLYRNLWLTARWLTADEITGPRMGMDTLQVDVNARF